MLLSVLYDQLQDAGHPDGYGALEVKVRNLLMADSYIKHSQLSTG